MRPPSRLWLALLALAAPAAAQTPTVLYRGGDAIGPGLGRVADVGRFAITDLAEWIVVLRSDALDEAEDDVMLRNGIPTLQEGIPLAQPAGCFLDELGSVTLNRFGHSAWGLTVTPRGGTPLSALYFGTRLLAAEGDPVGVPGYSRTAVWRGFDGGTRIDDHGRVLVAGTVDDPVIPGAEDDALVLFEVDATGAVVGRRDVAHEGLLLPGQTETVRVLPSRETAMALNGRGEAMFVVGTNASNDTDRAIYVNETVVAQEGGPSPVAGLAWRELGTAAVALNDRGEYGFRGRLTGATNRQEALVRSGALVARQRAGVPALPGRVFLGFGANVPLHLSNAGELVYYAEVNGGESRNAALFAGDDLLVRKGETEVGGDTVVALPDTPGLFTISPGGRYVLFHARLAGAHEEPAFCAIDLGRVTPVPDCGGNAGRLARVRGFPVAGGVTTLGIDEGQYPGIRPMLLVASATTPDFGPCGVPLDFGELVIDFGPGTGNPIDGWLGEPWLADGPVEVELRIPADPAFVGVIVWAQAVFFDLGALLPGDSYRLTNAVEIEIGAP